MFPDPPEELLEDCKGGKVVLFAGSGVAADAGRPTGRGLLRRMLEELSKEDPSQNMEDLQAQVESAEPSLLKDVLHLRLGTEQVQRLLQRSLSEQSFPARQYFPRLGEIPFAGAITTNWDSMLNDAFVNKTPTVIKPAVIRPSTASLAAILRMQQFFLLKAYGDLNEPDSILFSPEQYRQIVSENPEYKRFVSSVFANGTLLFLGATPAEIRDFLSTIDIPSRPERAHFALVPARRTIPLEQERMAGLYNVTLLQYEPRNGSPYSESELERFVRELAHRLYRQASSAPALQPEDLHEVTLRNIGPFIELHLPVNQRWNVLLGDNGCGKSSVLRAIALALCGDDQRAEYAAASLLRSGASVGSIELRAGKSVYRTRLVRDEDRVRVSPETISPVQAGAWLAIGFPPLRGVSYSRINGPSREDRAVHNPQVEDLLPLVNSFNVDSRLDNLRQWVVNVSVSAELQKASGGSSSRSASLRDSFFKVIEHLVLGLPFTFYGIDPQTWEVLIETDDGVLPIHRLSQGMSAFLTWVGTLLQRLYEVHGENPESARALILLDEIDAHLHPLWQAKAVPMLREIFPNLQVLATTHSPLIVANLQDGELYRLRRGERGSGVTVAAMNQSFRGWRTDQILTGPAFDLDSTRDRDTTKDLEEYKSLLAKQDPTQSERDRLNQLSRKFERTIPSYQETEEARQTSELVQEWIRGQIKGLPTDEKEKVLAEAKLYLTELKTGGPNASR